MRNSFMDVVMEEAALNEDVFIITGDAGLGVFDDFRVNFPDRFLNLGVAEQNATGFAAGLALSGLRVFVYNIIPFLLYRPFEQVRNAICYQDLPVTLVGIGSGLSYAPAGMSHYALEDVALARTLPNLGVLAPCDPAEAVACARYALTSRGPLYVRLAKRGEPVVNTAPEIDVDRPQILEEGRGVGLLFYGSVAPEVLGAAALLRARGLAPRVVSLPRLAPFDSGAVAGALKGLDRVVTVEDHFTEGGLGTLMSVLKARTGAPWSLSCLGVPDRFVHEVGSTGYLREKFGLSPDAIAAAAVGAGG